MKMYKEQIELESHGGRPTYFDITPQLKKLFKRAVLKMVSVLSPRRILPALSFLRSLSTIIPKKVMNFYKSI